MSKRLTTGICIKKCVETHGDKYDYSQTQYTFFNEKLKIICPKHGIFYQQYHDHVNGHGCRKCYSDSNKTWTTEQDQFLVESYQLNGAVFCSQQLNKSWSAVQSRGYILGLSRTRLADNDDRIPNHIWSGILNRVKHNKYNIDITATYIWELFIQQKSKCALTGWKLTFSKKAQENTVSVDRIDSSLGYVKGNIQLTHKLVNKCKLNCPESVFYKMCCAVADYKKELIEYKTVWEIDQWNDTERPVRKIVDSIDIDSAAYDILSYSLKKV